MIVFCGILWNYCFFSELFITESWKLQIWQIRAVSLNWKYKKIADLASTFISLPHKKQNSKFYVWINTLFYTRAFLLQASLKFSFFLLDFHLYIRFDAKIDFPGGSDGKASAYNVGDPGSIPGLGRSPGEGNGNPLQYSCLENSMDRGA